MRAQAEIEGSVELREERARSLTTEVGDAAPSRSEVHFLTQEDYPAWEKLVEVSPQGSVFTMPWWLGAVGGSIRILGYFKSGRLLAGIPLYFEKRFGINVCTMPKLTQTLGPVLSPVEDHGAHHNGNERPILCALAGELARQSIFFQAFHPSLQNWSPFYWRGFTQTSRATYVIDSQARDKLWQEMTRGGRRAVRNAEHHGLSVTECSPDDVWNAEQKTFAAQGTPVPHSIAYLRSLYRVAKERNSGECFAAVDENRIVRSAALMVWNRNRAYAIALGADPSAAAHGSASMLAWHMIQFAAERAPIFDFTGSMIEGVDQFLRSLGARQVQYSWIMKFPTPLRMYLAARHKI